MTEEVIKNYDAYTRGRDAGQAVLSAELADPVSVEYKETLAGLLQSIFLVIYQTWSTEDAEEFIKLHKEIASLDSGERQNEDKPYPE